MNDETQTEQAQDAPAAGETDETKQQAQDAGSETEQKTEAQAEGDEGEGDEDAGGDKPKRPSGAQRQKRRMAAILAENAELHRRLSESQPREQRGDGKAGADTAPQEKDFDGDYLAYERARQAYETRQAVREEFARIEQTHRAGREIDAQREQVIAYEERLDDARERIADFDDAMKQMKGVQVRNDVVMEIMSSDKGPLIAYHLAKNPERLRELNGLSGRELAREIGRLEGSVRMPAGNKQTRAGSPPSPVKGGAAPTPSLANKSPEEYRKLRASGVT
jgi:hypothetical protein